MTVVRHLTACVAAVGLAVLPGAALAQPASAIPEQSWYPEGYHDLRIASAAQVATFPRDPANIVMGHWDDPNTKIYDLIDCNLGVDLAEDLDNRTQLLSELALDIARLRAEFASLGYRPEVYDEPLLAHERALLAAIEATATDLVRELVTQDDGYSYYQLPEGWVRLSDLRSEQDLLAELESRRTRLQPGHPRFVALGECGAGEEEFEIRLVPANGELWLINAFAFRVCERKVADPWNHRACGWTQYQAGDSTFASGRYMYEARWPDGTVKRGARVLQADFENDETGAVTFRR
jgi:hypothetical protein